MLMDQNRSEYELLVCDQPIPESFDLFKLLCRDWFKYGRCCQFLVRRCVGLPIIGTVFYYRHDPENKSVMCSCFFSPHARRKSCTMEALAMSFEFCASVLGVRRINFSVYSHNLVMLALAHKLGAYRLGETRSTEDILDTVATFELSETQCTQISAKLARLRSTR